MDKAKGNSATGSRPTSAATNEEQLAATKDGGSPKATAKKLEGNVTGISVASTQSKLVLRNTSQSSTANDINRGKGKTNIDKTEGLPSRRCSPASRPKLVLRNEPQSSRINDTARSHPVNGVSGPASTSADFGRNPHGSPQANNSTQDKTITDKREEADKSSTPSSIPRPNGTDLSARRPVSTQGSKIPRATSNTPTRTLVDKTTQRPFPGAGSKKPQSSVMGDRRNSMSSKETTEHIERTSGMPFTTGSGPYKRDLGEVQSFWNDVRQKLWIDDEKIESAERQAGPSRNATRVEREKVMSVSAQMKEYVDYRKKALDRKRDIGGLPSVEREMSPPSEGGSLTGSK